MTLFRFFSLHRTWWLALLSGSALLGQSTGRVTGTVVDPAGAAVASAHVELRIPGADQAALAARVSAEGLFAFIGVAPGYYDLVAEASGFQRISIRKLKVEPGREIDVGELKLEVGAVTQTVEVTAEAPGVQTTSAEVSTTITNAQLQRLPLFDRNPLAIIHTQAGVTTSRGPTVINGLRTSYANVTIDGINVQDNAVRSNALNFLPNLPFSDQIAEVTLVTSLPDATWIGGAVQLSMTTPSGTNDNHGSLYWYNRNSALAANDWFRNKDGLEKPSANLNQLGGTYAGPIFRNKLFYFANYELSRDHPRAIANRTILTADARRGIFTYRDAAGTVRKANLMTLMGTSLDPTIQDLLRRTPSAESINNFRTGDSTPAFVGNSGGYSFNIRDTRLRDNVTSKLDYFRSTRHSFAATYIFNRDFNDRPDDSNNFSVIPAIRNDNTTHLLSLGWRWTPTPRLTNEVRGGFNRGDVDFVSIEELPPYLLAGLVFSNPLNTAYPEYRRTYTYNLASNAGYVTGRHNLRFGYHQQNVRLRIQNPLNTVPTYGIGIGLGNDSLEPQMLPGISAVDFERANNYLATLAGVVESYSQTFNITNRTSGFVPGAHAVQNLIMDNYAFYVQDTWKLRPRLTASLGVRWDYRTPVDERDALALMPIVLSNDVVRTLRSDAILDFAGRSVNRPWYQRDLNNFAPNLSLAWDPFGKGKTVVRAGYSMSFVNDEDLVALFNNLINTNSGLSADSTDFDLTASVRSLPRIPVPSFSVPRLASDNLLIDPLSAFGMPHPNLATPYVQHWTFGVQQEWRSFLFEGRYVANHGTKMWRALDYNQVVIRENGFLDDFVRARRNGELSFNARGVFDPRYNPNIAGSQPLTIFPRMVQGGFLTNSVVQGYIRTGEPAELATIYFYNFINGPVEFFRNPNTLGANLMTNFSHSTYHALQLDVRRRVSTGLFFQVNYSLSKVLSDSAGDNQFRFEPLLDANNPSVERSRAPFDLTHAIKSNFVWDLPFGSGRLVQHPKLNWLLGGWDVNGFAFVLSGAPFSVLSQRATLNRSGTRSAGNTATTLLTMSQLDDLMGVRMTGDGPYFIAASAIGVDGRAVAGDGRAPFSGQAFFHPNPGEIGALQRRVFNGPWKFDFDIGLRKVTRLNERFTLKFVANAFSAFNLVNWFVGDYALDSVNFGRIGQTATDPRNIQLGLHLLF
jgi:hypothetical protein